MNKDEILKTMESILNSNAERIEELEKKNTELQHKIDTLQGFLDRDVEFDNLQKENALLKGRTGEFEKQILGLLYKYESVYKRFPDLKDAMNKAESILKENAELKCECRRCVYSDSPCILSDYGKDRNGICDHFKDVFDENIELKDELKKWKDEWQEQVQKATDEGYARTLQTMQLTKAKELIREIIDTPVFNQMGGELYENEGYTELVEEAEQFLKE